MKRDLTLFCNWATLNGRDVESETRLTKVDVDSCCVGLRDEAPPVRAELDRRGPEEEVRNDVGHLWCRLIKRKLPDLHTSEGN
jgi:hypothetical protein